ncbi:heme peroxidase [Chytriomyces sp. MP71]|nr:heme peroxidase [Chytriomyces sp. MP71]
MRQTSVSLMWLAVSSGVHAQAVSLTQQNAQRATQALTFLIQGPGECLFQHTDLPVAAPSKNMAALWLRAIFHDAGTYNAASGSGGLDGSLQFAPEGTDEVNMGIPPSLASRFIPSSNSISPADMVALGGIVTVAVCGGPQVPFRAGRLSSNTSNNVADLPSDAFAPVSTIKAGFLRMGLSALDMVTLTTGSHSMGGAHAVISPNITKADFEPFDNTPGVFDNDIFKQVLAGKCVIPIDCAFAKDPELLPYIQQFAKDQSAFFAQYAISFEKMLNLNRANLSDPITVMISQHANLLAEGIWPQSNASATASNTATVTTKSNAENYNGCGALACLTAALLFLV